MSTLVVARRNRKLAAFRDAVEELLGRDIVEEISRLVVVMTVQVHPEPLLEDHSIALSASITRRESIHVGLFRAADTLFGTRPRYLWGGFLPAGERSHVLYTTGHGFVISVARLGKLVTVTARSQEGPIFEGDVETYEVFNGELHSCYFEDYQTQP